VKFVGVDLGWQSQPSGFCTLILQGDRLTLATLTRYDRHGEVLAAIAAIAEPALIAVDAPTLIPNATGMRMPDRLAHRYFGKYHAGAYPANQSLPFAAHTVAFGQALEAQGFAHAPTLIPRQPGRYQIEVFPHPATITLFGLPRILRYKKGRLADRAAELTRLRQYLQTVLPTLVPPCFLPELPPIPATGAALKEVEDRLDSLLCAYIGAHWWYWGTARNWVLGDRAQGYIVVPAPSSTELFGPAQLS
jgi:predicted RNase H-like nuclease